MHPNTIIAYTIGLNQPLNVMQLAFYLAREDYAFASSVIQAQQDRFKKSDEDILLQKK